MPKIMVSMKDPDTLYDAINDSVDEELEKSGLDNEEQEAIKEIRQEKYSEIASEWFQHGEYLTVEIDTDAKTIRVVPISEMKF